MMSRIETKLAEMRIELATFPAPTANYVPFTRSGNMLFVSGQACFLPNGTLLAKGRLGDDVSVETGIAAARQCAINILAVAKAALANLDRIARVVRLGGFVNSTSDFTGSSIVLDGASDFMVTVFGEQGRHARTAVGAAALPGSTAVQIEAVFEVH
jgi:enamine deaminase RidA (YjgF/YER057c/UK114 family)